MLFRSAQSYRAYLKGSTTAVIVADYLRRLGYEAQAHSNADGDVMQIPLMLRAGLGEELRLDLGLVVVQRAACNQGHHEIIRETFELLEGAGEPLQRDLGAQVHGARVPISHS